MLNETALVRGALRVEGVSALTSEESGVAALLFDQVGRTALMPSPLTGERRVGGRPIGLVESALQTAAEQQRDVMPSGALATDRFEHHQRRRVAGDLKPQ